MLTCPHDLGAGQAADDSGHRGVEGLIRPPRPTPFAVEQPEADHSGHGHQNTEARDLEVADAERNGEMVPSLLLRGRPSRAARRV